MARFKRLLGFPAWLVDAICGMGGILAGAAIVFSMLAICYEVVMRYVFTRPTIWANEVCEYLLILSVFIAAGYILREEGHVRVDLLLGRFSQKRQALLYIITSCLALIFCGILVWQGWLLVTRSYQSGYTSTALLRAPLWIPQSFIPIGFGLLGLQFVVKIGRHIRFLFTGPG